MRSEKTLRPDVAVAAVVLMPFLTVGFSFRMSLIVQAAGILAVTCATLWPLTGADVRRRLVQETPRSVTGGIAAVTAAGLLGTVVGLVRGNDPVLVAGQALAMGLLPLAALGGLGHWTGPNTARQWRNGLMAGVTAGCSIQLLWGLWRLIVTGDPTRLFLPNSVSVIGSSLMGLCFAAALLDDSDVRLRRSAWVTVLAVGAVILGSSLRSLWILAPVALVAVFVFRDGFRGRRAPAALASIVIVAVTAAGTVKALEAWAARERADVLEMDVCSLFHRAGKCDSGVLIYRPERTRRRHFGSAVTLPRAGAWQVRVHGHGDGLGAAVIALRFLDASGAEIGRISVPVRAGVNVDWRVGIGAPDNGWKSAEIRLSRWEGSSGTWRIEAIECSPVSTALAARFAAKALAIEERIAGVVRVVRAGRFEGDSTLGFRWYESVRVFEEITRGSSSELLFGHGLGATVILDVDGFDNRGHWVHFDEVNYIHDWYLFLLFKLGIVGSILVLGAVGTWIVWTVRFLLPRDRAFGAAAVVAWLVYCVWSLTSPEILDFRMAPLWGWLVSVSAALRE